MKPSLYRLIETLDDDTTVVTGSARLARELRLVKAKRETELGRASWRTPDILPYSGWLSRSWQSHQERSSRPLPSALTPWQERVLWEQCIVEDLTRRGGPALLNVPGAALHAQHANAILDDWCEGAPDENTRGLWVGEDSMAFREWRKAVQRRCREQHWVLASGVSARLLQQVGRITRRIIFAGFYTLSTAQRRVQAALRDAGVEVVVVGLSSAAPVARKVSFGEPADELEAAIRWARALLERGTRSIGVIVPDLSQRRMSVERCFDAILDSSRDYELSVAPSLATVPMVRDALLMLRLVRASVPMTEVEQVLRSPFVRRAEEEIHQRSNLLGALRQRGKPELSLGRRSAPHKNGTRIGRDLCAGASNEKRLAAFSVNREMDGGDVGMAEGVRMAG